VYQVTIKNGDEESIINSISSDIEAPRLKSGSIKQGINTIDSFNFTILSNNPGFNKINSLSTTIEIKKVLNNIETIEFRGRVLLPSQKMESSGEFYKTVVCESELGYLMDSVQRYGEYHDITIKNFLKIIIENHNNQVSDEQKFTVGIVEVTDSNNSLYRYLGYDKTFSTIKDKLLDRLGGELRVRWENGVRYLDYLWSIGEEKETEIRISKNLKTIEQEKDPSDIITRLIPLGKKLEDSDARLTIASVNNGIDYIDDTAAIAEFGIIVDSVTWDDVTDPSNLKSKGQAKLIEVNRLKKKHKVDALDLATIGLDFDTFDIGNTYPVINPIMEIDEPLRVVEKTINIFSPQNSSLTVGDKFESIAQYQLNISKTSKNVATLSSRVDSTINTVVDINSELNNTIEVLNSTNEVLANTSSSVADIGSALQTTNQSIIAINNLLQNNINDVTNIKTDIQIIKTNVETIDNKLTRLKRMSYMGV